MFFFFPVKSVFLPVKKTGNGGREKIKCPWKPKKSVREKKRYPRKKKDIKIPLKLKESAREKKKSGREKVEKFTKKWAWKKNVAREKIQKLVKIGFHGYFLFLRGRKKTLILWEPLPERYFFSFFFSLLEVLKERTVR